LRARSWPFPPSRCADARRRSARPAVPFEFQARASVVGFSEDIRYFPRDAAHVEDFEKEYLSTLERERVYLGIRGKDEPMPPSVFLAISGGGDNGAFGAGLLNGWTKSGTRPVFKLVTGVSTGALIAPFAFLGSAYDGPLKALYTGISIHDVAVQRSILSVLYSDAMADNAPLRKLVEKHITQDMLEAIAAEHEKGRVLLVATTNPRRAQTRHLERDQDRGDASSQSLALVQKILIASAAIPGTFPPVMIDVEVNGKTYQEMHVDGGTASQVFVYPAAIRLHELAERQRAIYVIRNARLDPEWAQVERRTLPIAFRSITTLIHNQGLGDLYRIFAITQRDKIDYNLAYIPASFQFPHNSDFDTSYMKALFGLGEEMAQRGYEWSKRPPVLVSGVDDESSERSPLISR
jgi:predicted acylesterase/phospholipase RssA